MQDKQPLPFAAWMKKNGLYIHTPIQKNRNWLGNTDLHRFYVQIRVPSVFPLTSYLILLCQISRV